MRQSLKLLKHVQLIKFVGGPHSFGAPEAAKPHPLSPSGKMPSLQRSKGSGSGWNAMPIELKEGEVLLRCELSSRFRYKPAVGAEAEDIESGGASLVF